MTTSLVAYDYVIYCTVIVWQCISVNMYRCANVYRYDIYRWYACIYLLLFAAGDLLHDNLLGECLCLYNVCLLYESADLSYVWINHCFYVLWYYAIHMKNCYLHKKQHIYLNEHIGDSCWKSLYDVVKCLQMAVNE